MHTTFSTIVALCLFTLSACGGGRSGGGGSVTVTATLTDADGATVTATAGTTADPASFTVTFDQAMDAASLTTAGNVTLVCGPLTPSIAITSVSSTEYTLTVEDAYKYQLLDCTLTLTANVKTSGGSAITAQTFVFTVSACAVSDDFNSDTQDCWMVPTSEATWTSWAALLSNGILAFDTASSEIDYANSQAGTTSAAIYKTVAVDPQGFVMTIHTNALAGFDDTPPADGPTDSAIVSLMREFSLANEFLWAGITWGDDGGVLHCLVLHGPGDGAANAIMVGDCTRCASESCEVRLTVSDRQISGSYSIAGEAFQQMVVQGGAFPTDDAFTDLTLFVSVFIDNGGDNRASVDAVTASGLTVGGQYR